MDNAPGAQRWFFDAWARFYDLQLVQRNTSAQPRPAGQASSGRGVARETVAAAERHYRADGWGMPRTGCLASGYRADRAELRRQS